MMFYDMLMQLKDTERTSSGCLGSIKVVQVPNQLVSVLVASLCYWPSEGTGLC